MTVTAGKNCYIHSPVNKCRMCHSVY